MRELLASTFSCLTVVIRGNEKRPPLKFGSVAFGTISVNESAKLNNWKCT
jgi:hypothetical protein